MVRVDNFTGKDFFNLTMGFHDALAFHWFSPCDALSADVGCSYLVYIGMPCFMKGLSIVRLESLRCC